MTMRLRTRILLTCLICMISAMLLQLVLFNTSSSRVISEQTDSINRNTLQNLSDDVYSHFKSIEKSLT